MNDALCFHYVREFVSSLEMGCVLVKRSFVSSLGAYVVCWLRLQFLVSSSFFFCFVKHERMPCTSLFIHCKLKTPYTELNYVETSRENGNVFVSILVHCAKFDLFVFKCMQNE